MTLKKELKLGVGYLHNLRNDEFAALVSDVVNIANTFEIDDKMASMLLEKLTDDEKILKRVVYAPLGHKNSKLIDEYHDNMRRLMIGLKSSIKSLHYLRDEEKKQAAHTLRNWIGPVTHEMGSQTKLRALHAASVLTAEYNNNERVSNAVEVLGLSVFYKEIESLYNEITDMMSERTDTKSELKSLREDLRERVTYYLGLFFSILLARVSFEDEQSPMYYSLCTRFDQVMSSALAIQRTRTTKNRNRRERRPNDNPEPQINIEMPDRHGAANGRAEINTKKTEAGIDRMEAHSNNVKAIGGSADDIVAQTPANMPDTPDIKLLPPRADNI